MKQSTARFTSAALYQHAWGRRLLWRWRWRWRWVRVSTQFARTVERPLFVISSTQRKTAVFTYFTPHLPDQKKDKIWYKMTSRWLTLHWFFPSVSRPWTGAPSNHPKNPKSMLLQGFSSCLPPASMPWPKTRYHSDMSWCYYVTRTQDKNRRSSDVRKTKIERVLMRES